MRSLVAWDLRTVDFRGLRLVDDGRTIPVMELAPRVPPGRADAWRRTCELWLELAPHPNLLDAVDHAGDVMLLRYAAIDWRHTKPTIVDHATVEVFACWGAQLAHALAAVRNDIAAPDLAYLCRPFVLLDVAGNARVGFLPMSPRPTDERELIELCALLIARLCTVEGDERARHMRDVLADCRGHRIDSLAALRDRFIHLAEHARTAVRRGSNLAAWSDAEEAAGLLALGRPADACEIAERALEADATVQLAHDVRGAALKRMNLPPKRYVPPRRARAVRRSWAEVEPIASERERDRDFAKALELYESVDPATAPAGELDEARARVHLALGQADHATNFARRAIASEPRRLAAHALLVRALLARRLVDDALAAAGALLAASPYDGMTHYLTGRCQMVAGRYADARESLDLALVLSPKLVEAMLLRREVDRAIGLVQRATGVAAPMVIDLPAHLADLAAPLAAGRTEAVIPRLAELADDPVAQLLLGSCLEREQRYEEALAAYARVTGESLRSRALAGTSSVMLALDRPADALAALGEPADADAVELRARILERLGRTEEAFAELNRFVALAAGRSDLRVRAARLRVALTARGSR